MINILLVAQPTDVSESVYIDHFKRWSGVSTLSKDKFSIRFLCTERAYNENKNNHLLDDFNPILIKNDCLNSINRRMNSVNELKNTFFCGKYNSKFEIERIKYCVKDIIINFIPDIIISHARSVEILKCLFPKALYLVLENSIFARFPFARCLAYDPYGHLAYSFLNEKVNCIKRKYEAKNTDAFEEFKKEFINIFSKYADSSVMNEILFHKKLFKKTVLFPLAGGNSIYLDAFVSKPYQCEFDMIEYVMQNTPENIGVFLTRHDSDPSITEKDIEYFRNKYSNFIYIDTKFNGVHSASLDYYPHVDAVLNTCSKTGLTACLWDKPIVSLSDKWNDFTKDFDFSAENIVKAVNMGKSVKDNILFFYLMNYVILPSDYNSSEKMKAFFINKLNKFRNEGITENFFEQIHNPEEAYREILMRTEENLIKAKQAKEASERKVLIDNITSQKMENERLAAEVEKLQHKIVESHKFDNLRIRLLSHIAFGKAKRHYQNKWRKIKRILKND